MSKAPLRSVKNYRAFLQAEAAKIENPEAGFFGPKSMAWRLNREVVLGLVVLRTILMQVAHPKVAQGVADHSDFEHKPFERALATLKAQQAIVFGNCEESMGALVRIYARHVAVVGEVEGQRYEANDPKLLFWVYATLIDSMHYAYRNLLPDLSVEEWAAFYEEGKFFAHLMGIPTEMVPSTKTDFDQWINGQLEGEEIHVLPVARQIAHSLLSTPLRLVWPLTAYLAAGSLPDRLRERFELPWGRVREGIYRRGAKLLRWGIRWLPSILHSSPAYWMASRRVRRSTLANR